MTRSSQLMRFFPLVAALLVAASCRTGVWVLPDGRVVGTWGGDNAGLIATDSSAHVHIGCESGDAAGPIQTDTHGDFEATGEFTVGAYPVGPGTTHPAVYRGHVVGKQMTLTVVLSDTTRQFGPVTLTYGVEPRMGPCPICTTEQAIARSRAHRPMR